MKKIKSITTFALVLLVAGGINIGSSKNVQADEIQPIATTVTLVTEESNPTEETKVVETTKLTGTDIVDYAKQFIGIPYRSGGTTISGFDCSGFTMYVCNHFNIELPHNAQAQSASGTVVSKADLQIGDLIFFGNSISHVGIYVGDGLFIHSPKPGSQIKIAELKYMPGYNTARRIIPQ